MVIVDTSVWIDLLHGKSSLRTEWLTAHIPLEPIGLTDLILCEVLQGFRADADFERVREELANFSLFACGGERLALKAAQNFRFLRKQGLTVRSTVDCLIASFCIEHGHTLLHGDRDYEGFETHLGLRTVRPLQA